MSASLACRTRSLVWFIYIASAVPALSPVGHAQQIVLGSTQVQSLLDTNDVGIAEAFPFTANSSGAVNYLSLFLDNTNTSSNISVGLYSNYYGHPSKLLSQASIANPATGQWNPVLIPEIQVTQGKRYWVAVLGLNGNIRFRDANGSWCHSETSRQASLTSLPATWWTGSQYTTCLVSMFGFRSTSGTISISVFPTSAALKPFQQAQFGATVSGTTNTAITWKASGGTITSGGLYTAPSNTGTYTVTATSSADSTKSSSAAVAVSQSAQGAISMSITPTSATLSTGGQQQFSASVSGTSNTSVSWKASGGTISSGGLYTAPSAGGTYTVTATSAADATASASAIVGVVAQNVVVSLTPATVNMPSRWTQQFNAAVSGSTNTGVTWAVSQGSGTITQSGLFTAPGVAQADVVTVTSQADPTKAASAQITVAAPHSVTLSWSPSTSSGISYYKVYRGTVNGGPYSLLTSGIIVTSYTDATVVPGSTYYYVTSAVDSTGSESGYSNVAPAVIPTP